MPTVNFILNKPERAPRSLKATVASRKYQITVDDDSPVTTHFASTQIYSQRKKRRLSRVVGK